MPRRGVHPTLMLIMMSASCRCAEQLGSPRRLPNSAPAWRSSITLNMADYPAEMSGGRATVSRQCSVPAQHLWHPMRREPHAYALWPGWARQLQAVHGQPCWVRGEISAGHACCAARTPLGFLPPSQVVRGTAARQGRQNSPTQPAVLHLLVQSAVKKAPVCAAALAKFQIQHD